MKSFIAPFLVSLVACGLVYFLLDFGLMQLQELDLFFHH